MREFAADFETNTTEETCAANPVWAWGVSDIADSDIYVSGISIDSFIEFTAANPGRYWFHNAGFDSKFVISWLMLHGYKHVGAPKLGIGEFTTLIDGLNKFYHMAYNVNGSMVEIADSYKKLPMKLSVVAKAYGLELSKGEIDYSIYRPKGHQLTEQEADYLKRDVVILAQALNHRFGMGTKLTTGADCLAAYKDLIGKRRWQACFPRLNAELDADLRRAYRGGFVYANPAKVNQHLGECGHIDVNSLYPYVMRSRQLPWGYPHRTIGTPYESDKFPLWIAEVTFTAELKRGAIPCIQVHGSIFYNAREYQREITEPVTLMVTNVDWALICDMYTVDVYNWGVCYAFKSQRGMFDDYIDMGMSGKQNAKSPGERQNYKLWLNNLYGKFAQKTVCTSKEPRLDSAGVVHYVSRETTETREPVYLPVGIFVTAWARDYTIRTAHEFGSRFVYSDTDSIIFQGREIPADIRVHDKELGAWALEATPEDVVCLRAKTYAELNNGTWAYTCAGMVQGLKDVMSIEDFRPGFTTDIRINPNVAPMYLDESRQKLVPKNVKGGVILVPRPFSIK